MQQVLFEKDFMSDFVRFNSCKYSEHLSLRYQLWMAKMIARITVCGVLLLVALVNYARLGGG